MPEVESMLGVIRKLHESIREAVVAAAGSYDGYRYIHVKAQFNSDGTDQLSLSSFSVHGAKIVP